MCHPPSPVGAIFTGIIVAAVPWFVAASDRRPWMRRSSIHVCFPSCPSFQLTADRLALAVVLRTGLLCCMFVTLFVRTPYCTFFHLPPQTTSFDSTFICIAPVCCLINNCVFTASHSRRGHVAHITRPAPQCRHYRYQAVMTWRRSRLLFQLSDNSAAALRPGVRTVPP